MGLREMAEQAEGATELRAVLDRTEGSVPADPGAYAALNKPDVAESPIAAEMDVAVHVAWSRVMGEVEYIRKGRSPGLNYTFRGIDAVLDAVGPALRKHGVLVMPVKVTPTYTVVTSKSGAVMNYCRAVVQYAVMGPRGDVLAYPDGTPLVGESLGEAFDTGDKASTKAQSVALREFYVKAFAIPVNEPARDPEYGTQHEMGAPPPPTPAEYRAEILAETTSVARLHQIKDALDSNRAIGSAEVELLDGRRITLANLVREVGRKRAAGEPA